MNIFITGGTTGIGLELAKSYLKDGHRVAICGRHREKLEKNYLEDNKNLSFYELDVTERENVKKCVDDFAAGGGIDLMVANAGIPMGRKSAEIDFDKINLVLDINLAGVIHSFEAALKHMKQQKSGQLVGISSVAGYNGMPGTAIYSATKGAVMLFCESLAIDLRSEGIAVTYISPGFIRSPLSVLNKHPMPFIMEAGAGVRKIKKAIKSKKVGYAFPLPMYLIVKFFRALPRGLYVWIMQSPTFNFAKREKKALSGDG